jgi:formate hydrogenlyase subunit 4
MISDAANIIFSIIQSIVIILLSPLFVGIIRKINSRLQSRQGAKIIQPYYDLAKLFHKESVVSNQTSWIFKVTPYICIAAVFITSLMIPVFIATSLNLIGGIVVATYCLIIMRVFMVLSGLDARTAFGGMGSS